MSEYLTGRLGVPYRFGSARTHSPPHRRQSVIHGECGGVPHAQQVCSKKTGSGAYTAEVNVVAESVPQSLRHLIERQLERLTKDTQHLLEVASVAGMEFSAAEVATGLQIEVEAVEARCDDSSARDNSYGGMEPRNGRMERWVNAMASCMRCIGMFCTGGWRRHGASVCIDGSASGKKRRMAAGGRDCGGASDALRSRKRHKTRRSPFATSRRKRPSTIRQSEAIGHLTKGLGFLKALANSPESFQQELSLQMALGPALIATKGYAASEVEQTYSRARELCQQLEDPSVLFPALFGLWSYYITRAEYGPTRKLAEQIFTLARQHNDSALLLQAHRALAETFSYWGNLPRLVSTASVGSRFITPGSIVSHPSLCRGAWGLLPCAHRVGAMESRLS